MNDLSELLAVQPYSSEGFPADPDDRLAVPLGAKLVNRDELVAALVSDAEEAELARREGKPRGAVTGFPGLDRLLGGFIHPGLHVIQAGPGAGKTAFSLQVATNCGRPAIYVAVEETPKRLFLRVISRLTDTPLHSLKNGVFSPAEIEVKARRALDLAPQLAFLDGTRGHASRHLITQAAEAWAGAHGGQMPLVVIDSLQPWARSSGVAATEYELVSAAVSSLDQLAKDLHTPVLCISQRGRAANLGSDRIGMHGGKGSGDVEYLADTVAVLEPGEGSPLPVALRIYKNRHGEPNTSFLLDFRGEIASFTESLHQL